MGYGMARWTVVFSLVIQADQTSFSWRSKNFDSHFHILVENDVASF